MYIFLNRLDKILIILCYRVLFDELLETTKTYIKNVIEVTPSLLLEVAPHYYATPTL